MPQLAAVQPGVRGAQQVLIIARQRRVEDPSAFPLQLCVLLLHCARQRRSDRACDMACGMLQQIID